MIGNEDYTGVYNTTFPAGMNDTLLTIAILNDDVYEDSERFDVIISNALPNRVTLGTIRRATVTIIDFGNLLLYKAHTKM